MANSPIDLDFEQSRIALAALVPDAVVLCASQRLARNLRRDHDRLQLARGLARWQPLQALAPAQWLEAVMREALLAGEIAVAGAPRLMLSDLQERILWERAIADGAAEAMGATGAMEEALFDREGLANAAVKANALMAAWDIRIPMAVAEQSEETRQFLRWREEFQRLCSVSGWLEAARYFDWQIDCLKSGAGRLPSQLALAGFDRYNLQEARLARVLMQRGVEVYELEQGLPASAQASVVTLPDRAAECRAAAAWARQQLALNPAARLGIVVPELGALRETLAATLDDALDPAAVSPALAEMPRRYNFSLGLPLARQPLVAVALQLLELAAQPRRIGQEEFTALLRQPYWSADVGEADSRARLDARMREFLAPTFSLERALRFMEKTAEKSAAQGLDIARLLADLNAYQAVLAGQAVRQSPSAWALACGQLLEAAGWPGERRLSSHEYQARHAFTETLDSLAELDVVLGRVSLAEACRRLVQLCRERIFQPATAGDPPVQVMGLLEIADTPLDALWAMGMNDHLWPPPARPNPLLPAELQRRARAPGASAGIQGEFAAVIQRRLLRSAPQVCFSWARSESGRELRPSPLIAAITTTPPATSLESAHPGLIETLAGRATLERIEDALAPPVGEGETLRGGTGMLRAQAICPAWAFYRYRLGAKALEEPVDGLDAAARGTLLHAVLQCFWQGRGSRDLLAMTLSTRQEAMALAVDQALRAFNATLEQTLTPRFLALERERLLHLVDVWLDVESQRTQPFHVVACEEQRDITIEGIAVHLVMDRIDQLDDGSYVILDYKTGGSVSHASWGEARIVEPQLPIYAAQALIEGAVKPAVSAVAFAKVRLEDCGFIGIAAAAGLLPKVAAIDDAAARKVFPQQADWQALLAHWQASNAAIAREIKAGQAAVSFNDEKDLAYCEVLPLLRLAERRGQFENEPD